MISKPFSVLAGKFTVLSLIQLSNAPTPIDLSLLELAKFNLSRFCRPGAAAFSIISNEDGRLSSTKVVRLFKNAPLPIYFTPFGTVNFDLFAPVSVTCTIDLPNSVSAKTKSSSLLPDTKTEPKISTNKKITKSPAIVISL